MLTIDDLEEGRYYLVGCNSREETKGFKGLFLGVINDHGRLQWEFIVAGKQDRRFIYLSYNMLRTWKLRLIINEKETQEGL